MSHILYLTDQQLTETKRESRGNGIMLVSGTPSDSKTVQGMRYEFDSVQFSANDAKTWADTSGIRFTSWHFDEAKPRRRFWFEAAKVGKWHASNDGSGKPGFVELTRDKLEKAAQSVKAGLRRAKNKLTHAVDQRMAYELFGADGMGEIVDARIREDGVLELETDAPESVALAVESNLLKERSVELDPSTGALVACAWLGLSRPAVKGLAPIAFTEGDSIAPPAYVIDGQVIEFEEAEPASGSPGAKDGTEQGSKDSQAADPKEPDSEEEKKRMATEAELNARIEQLEAANKKEREGRVDAFLSGAVGKHITPADVAREKTIALSMNPEMLPQWEESIKARTVKDLTRPVGDTTPFDPNKQVQLSESKLRVEERTKELMELSASTPDEPYAVKPRCEEDAKLIAMTEARQRDFPKETYMESMLAVSRDNVEMTRNRERIHGGMSVVTNG